MDDMHESHLDDTKMSPPWMKEVLEEYEFERTLNPEEKAIYHELKEAMHTHHELMVIYRC